MIPVDIVIRQISHTPEETLVRLRMALAAGKMTLFAEIDHARGAAGAGLQLRPATVVVFGAPKAGTLLMQQEPLIGLDLPLRILVCQGAKGETMLVWHDLRRLAGVYGLEGADVLKAMSAGLAEIVEQIAGEGAVP